MCGRFIEFSDIQYLRERFGFRNDVPQYKPRYNVASTNDVLTVVQQSPRHAQMMRWGLVPFWAKDMKIGYKTINARAETAAESNVFRTPFRKRRCLILADGFYEWRKDGANKTPMYIHLKSKQPFAFAGLWDVWKPAEGEPVVSCTILTCEPNPFMSTIDDRMPVILSQEAEALWLDSKTEDRAVLKKLLLPYPAEEMASYPVSSMVNSPKNQGPELIQPVES
jgi:putative SOS response-associated peptidase YedK